MERLRDIALLLALTLLAALPGIASLPVIDRDEARYAQATVQMIETGDYIDIRFQDEPRYKKPIGSYWAQVASIHLTGQADDIRRGERPIWAHRLPSVLGAVLAVIFTYLAGLHLLSRRAALIGASLLAVSVSLVFEAHQAKTDAMLCACAAIALYGWVSARPWPFWLAIAAGILLKGPVLPGVVGLALITYTLIQKFPRSTRDLPLAEQDDGASQTALPSRWRSRIKSGNLPLDDSSRIRTRIPEKLPSDLSGTAIPTAQALLRPLIRPLPILAALALTLPWFIAIHIHSDGAFFTEALGRDFSAKLGSAQETHGGPPGYYLLTTLLMFWPGVIALPLALTFAWKNRTLPALLPLLTWLLPMWLILELVPTKLPHYTLPLYPALALICGAALSCKKPRWVGYLLFALVGFALTALAIFGISTFQFTDLEFIIAWLSFPTTILLLTVCSLSLGLGALFLRASTLAGLATAALPLYAIILTQSLPGDNLWFNPQVAKAAEGKRVVSNYFREPSLAYYLGTDTGLGLQNGINVGDLIFTEVHMLSGGPACSKTVNELSFSAFNYAKGDWLPYHYLLDTAACAPEELETWQAKELALQSDTNG